ncbi:intein-containing DNA gyrase subunit B [Patescibacteria group bacterium]|nr:intein-containing DNA gyrase subunit B [Patescibacteria group bacterium]MBU4023389.1 intein-containing DNA gyrase subunit B [Patescibacteria group bacterium]
MTQSNPEEYTAKDIFVLKGLDPVRKRPGMYIGSTGIDGLHHLVWECVDNGLDEAMAGYADEIKVTLLPDNYVQVIDNGRGIPVDIHKQTKKSALETVMTTLHSGAKFGKKTYQVSGGLHGVGVSVVCALSSELKADICRNGYVYTQEFSKGKPKANIKKGKKCPTKETSTSITFKPDKEIFETITFDRKTILNHLRRQAYLTRGVKIIFTDLRDKDDEFSYVFYFEGGLRSYVKYLSGDNEIIHENAFYVSKEKDDILIEAAFQYTREMESYEESFANNIYTIDGGAHLTGFRSALTRAINDYAKSNDYLKEGEEPLNGKDIKIGINAVVSVKLKEPQFEGQTKGKLGNPEAKTAVEMVVNQALPEFLEQYSQDARAIVENSMLAARARMAASAARKTVLRKGVLDGLTLPGKLSDCSCKNPEESELFIVEGQSAGGCFSGDTKVALTDGRALSFKQLIVESKRGKQNYCYTMKDNGRVGIERIVNPHITRKEAKVIRVILDNNEEIVCTPDHKFMLRNGSYKEAQKLKSNDSLMPLIRRTSKLGNGITINGYEMVYENNARYYIFTHLLSDNYNIENQKYTKGQQEHCHHKDFNKLNNNPDNLIRLNKEEHLQLHRDSISWTMHAPEVIEKCNRIKRTKEYRERISRKMKSMSSMLRERAKKQWEDQEYKEYMKKKYLEYYYSHDDYRKKMLQTLYSAQRNYWAKDENRELSSQRMKDYYKIYPEKKEELSIKAKKQWQDVELLEWRAQKTMGQWTEDFRAKRKKAYDKTYFQESMSFLKKVYEKYNDIEFYDERRVSLSVKNTNLLRMDTMLARFFEGDKEKLMEALVNFNHKIKRIDSVEEKITVYDIEVPETHNFALESGIFVHNSCKGGRDRRFQAVLPLRGKVLNVERATLSRILGSSEIRALIIAMGTAIAQDFDLSKLRYHRLIIASDADVDGAHIRTLLLTLFFRYFRPIIEHGYLYIAQPPLYKIQSGKRIEYAYADADRKEIVDDMNKGKDAKINIQRYKGLGEMNADQLWDTTMNPENRILLQVKIEDAKEADRVFDVLMGKEVPPRKKFIKTHAKSVKNLDI